MSNKLTTIRIKQSGGYSDEIPVGVLAENVTYDNNHNLLEILGTGIDISSKGAIKQQLDSLFNTTDNLNVTALQQQFKDDLDQINDKFFYVTPQMFGAKGDGVTDDTASIQSAIDSGKSVIFVKNTTYLTTGTITITANSSTVNHDRPIFDSSLATIRYSGNGAAIKITRLSYKEIKIGQIICNTGDGVLFESTSADTSIRYIDFYFKEIAALNCIKVSISGSGWCGEVNVYGGRLHGLNANADSNGILITNSSSNNVNGWRFYNVGLEPDTSTGYRYIGLNVSATSEGFNRSISLIYPRTIEIGTNSYIVKTTGSCNGLSILAGYYIEGNKLNLSNDTNGTILGLYRSATQGFISYISQIYNGEVCDASSNHYEYNYNDVDLNNVTRLGKYVLRYGTLSNAPYTYATVTYLIVCTTVDNTIKQCIKEDNGNEWERTLNTSTNIWSSWACVSVGKKAGNGDLYTDANDVPIGSWWMNASTVTNGTNYPATVSGLMVVEPLQNGVKQIYTTAENTRVFVRTHYGQYWYSWKELTPIS